MSGKGGAILVLLLSSMVVTAASAAEKAGGEALLAANRDMGLLAHLQPLNGEEERTAFLAGRRREPAFTYLAEARYDTRAMQSRLMGMRHPEGPFGDFLREKTEELLVMNRLVMARGTARALTVSRALFGAPRPRLVARARAILRGLPEVEPDRGRTLDQGAFIAELQEALDGEGLAGWSVVPLPREGATNVVASRREIQVANRPRFSEIEVRRLAVHEVGVHACRAENGFTQPLSILAVGTAGYQSTEEGLAVTCELRSGTASSAVLKKYAARVLAVDAVARGLSFRATFERLRAEGIDEGRAWTCTLRAHRGGGFLKDQVYLAGLFEVLAFLKEGGDLRELFVGKIGVADLPRIRALLAAGRLHPPRLVPRFLDETPRWPRAIMDFLDAL